MKKKCCLVSLIVLSLLLLLIPACGSGGSSATDKPTVTRTTTPTATPTTNLPVVKIGAIISWSGPGGMAGVAFGNAAIKLAEWQVKQQGGILGGKEVKVIKFDDGTSVAQGVAGVTKLVLDENVSAIAWGGISGAEMYAVSDECEKQQVLFIPVASTQPEGVGDKNFTVEVMPGFKSIINATVKLVTEVIKPQRVALMVTGGYEDKEKIRTGWQQGIESAGIDIVYSEATAVGTIDFSPQLTKLLKSDPDVLIMNEDSEYSMSIAKQIMDLGGWGDIKVVGLSQSSSAGKLAGAEGWIIQTVWDPAIDTPAAKKFIQDNQTVNGSIPNGNMAFHYMPLWSTIEAVKFAGTTDRVAIAKSARSGNWEFDLPLGRAHIGTDGGSDLEYMWVQIQKGGKTSLYKP